MFGLINQISIEEKFINAIQAKNENKAISILQNNKINPSYNNNQALKISVSNNFCNLVDLLLKDKRVDPSLDNNYLIKNSAYNNNFNMVKILLQHHKVDPTQNTNRIIRRAFKRGHNELVEILWQNDKVRKTLKHNYKEFYYKIADTMPTIKSSKFKILHI